MVFWFCFWFLIETDFSVEMCCCTTKFGQIDEDTSRTTEEEWKEWKEGERKWREKWFKYFLMKNYERKQIDCKRLCWTQNLELIIYWWKGSSTYNSFILFLLPPSSSLLPSLSRDCVNVNVVNASDNALSRIMSDSDETKLL